MPTVGDIILAITPFALGVVAAFVGFVAFVLGKQRRLFRFLGIDPNARRLVVYLSSLDIPSGGALGFDGVTRSYTGVAVPTEELEAASRLARAFAAEPFKLFPPVLNKFLQDRYVFFRPLAIHLASTPLVESEMDFSSRSLICAGGPAFNIVTNYCVDHNLTRLKPTNNGTAVQIAKGKDQGETMTAASNLHDIAMVERVVDHSRNGTTVLISAGLSQWGTMAGIQYLIDHWAELDRMYGKREFALVLQVGPAGSQSLDDFLKNSTVIRRIPER